MFMLDTQKYLLAFEELFEIVRIFEKKFRNYWQLLTRNFFTVKNSKLKQRKCDLILYLMNQKISFKFPQLIHEVYTVNLIQFFCSLSLILLVLLL